MFSAIEGHKICVTDTGTAENVQCRADRKVHPPLARQIDTFQIFN